MFRRSAPLALLLLAACHGAAEPAPAAQAAEPAPAAQASAAVLPDAPPADAPVILAFGDSLYAGYRLDPGAGYPPRLEAALNRAGIKARVVNAGVSGDTTAAALQRLAFTLDNQPKKPALVMVGLGGNDMLRGLPPEQTRANLEAILAALEQRKIPAMLTGMLAAPNLGPDYTRAFNPIWPQLAREHHVPLVPFFLQPVIGNDKLLLDDHIHPNPQGVEAIVAATEPLVAETLRKVTNAP